MQESIPRAVVHAFLSLEAVVFIEDAAVPVEGDVRDYVLFEFILEEWCGREIQSEYEETTRRYLGIGVFEAQAISCIGAGGYEL